MTLIKGGYRSLIGNDKPLDYWTRQESIREIKSKLYDYHLNYVWLVDMLKVKRNLTVYPCEMSNAMHGHMQTPKADAIIRTSVDVIREYEKIIGVS